jgi:hypothetical protein
MYFIIPLRFDDFLPPARARDEFGGKTQKRDGREAGRPPMLATRDRLLLTVEGWCRAASGRVKPPAAHWLSTLQGRR